MRLHHLLATMLLCATAHSPVAAQDSFPSKPIHIVIPFSAGTGSDSMAREMAPSLSQQLGVPVIVDNREGAGGVIGTSYVAKAPADGYTLLLGATNMALTMFATEPSPYDVYKDFVTLGRIATVPMVVFTSGKGPYKTFGDIVQDAKANPGKLNYATSGKMGSAHVFSVEILRQFGFTGKDVPYKSASQGIVDTSQGETAFYLANVPIAAGLMQSGQLRAVAVGSKKRMARLPNVPTLAELSGRPDFSVILWYGFFTPAGTPPAVRARLTEAINKAVVLPEVRNKIELAGGEVDLASADEFTRQVYADTAGFGKLVRELGLNKE